MLLVATVQLFTLCRAPALPVGVLVISGAADDTCRPHPSWRMGGSCWPGWHGRTLPPQCQASPGCQPCCRRRCSSGGGHQVGWRCVGSPTAAVARTARRTLPTMPGGAARPTPVLEAQGACATLGQPQGVPVGSAAALRSGRLIAARRGASGRTAGGHSRC